MRSLRVRDRREGRISDHVALEKTPSLVPMVRPTGTQHCVNHAMISGTLTLSHSLVPILCVERPMQQSYADMHHGNHE